LAEGYAAIAPSSGVIRTVQTFDEDLVRSVRRMNGVQEADARTHIAVRFQVKRNGSHAGAVGEDVVSRWREIAGIHFRSKQHRGLHSLRHTLATQLLRAQTPLHVISDILGHRSSTSTMIYAKADVESLRTAALNTEEVNNNG